MGIYNQSTQLEIFKAIERENPTIPVPLTPDTVKLLRTVITGATATAEVEGIRYSGLRDFRLFKYNRIDIAQYFKNVYLTVDAPDCKKTEDILSRIYGAYGLYLTPADIVSKSISMADPELDYIYECTLEIVANHPLYFGSVVFHVTGVQLDLSDCVTVFDVDGIKDTSQHVAGKSTATFAVYGVDYSELSDYLKTYATVESGTGTVLTDVKARELAGRLSAIDGQPWVWSAGTAAFNLRAAKIYRHELVSKYMTDNPGFTVAKPNEEYQNVMLIQFGAGDLNTSWLNNWGYFIHYDSLVGME